MLNISFRKPKKEVYLALDIGSEAIKSLIFEKENKKSSFLKHSLLYFDELEALDIGDLKKEITVKKISGIIQGLKDKNVKKIQGVFLTLSSNILKGKAVSGIFHREDSKEKITEKEEKEILDKISESAQREISQDYALEKGILPQDIHFFNVKIGDTEIDGYKVPRILGFEGKEIKAQILVAFSPRYYFERIINIFDSLDLKILKITHTSEVILSDQDFREKGGVFMDIGGNITEITVFKNGKIEKIDTVDMGGDSFTRTIAESLGMSQEDAKDLKERYSRGELSESSRSKVKEIISKDILNLFEKIKAKLFEVKTLLPPQIYLFGGGSQLLGMEDILNSGNWKYDRPFDGNNLEPHFSFVCQPQINIIFPKDLIKDVSIQESFNIPQFTPISFLIKI